MKHRRVESATRARERLVLRAGESTSSAATGRVAPHNYEAEQALLGAVLAKNQVYAKVSGLVAPDDFADPLHGRIYQAAGTLIQRGQIANFLTLRNLFERDAALANAGGAKYLSRLENAVVTIINADDYARNIRDLADRRRLAAVLEEGIAAAHDFDVDRSATRLLDTLITKARSSVRGSDARLGEWNAGSDRDAPPPRGWLLGNIFCRGFVSAVIADGGTGKTAVRYCQLLSLATGRSLSGEHVFRRSRVLIVSLEDDATELRRRIRAVMHHHGVSHDEVDGWLYLVALRSDAGKLATFDQDGRVVEGEFVNLLRETIKDRKVDVVSIDPFVKAHSVPENDNNAIDAVMTILASLAHSCDIAIDILHHNNKGLADPGNANRGRGASSMKDGARLVYTLTPMSEDEAKAFGISSGDRRRLIRMDSAKVNIAPPATEAAWFRIVGVPLHNGTELYPNGDEVQTVEPWTRPNIWAGINNTVANNILDEIEAGLPDGNRFSDHYNAAADRAAWRVVVKHMPEKSADQARLIIATWLKTGVLTRRDCENPDTRHKVKGLFVAKRPS